MRKLNVFFFGTPKICLSDFVWFYGVLVGSVVYTLAILLYVN